MRMKTTIDEQRNQIRQRNHDIESQRNEIDAVSSIMKLSRLFLYIFFYRDVKPLSILQNRILRFDFHHSFMVYTYGSDFSYTESENFTILNCACVAYKYLVKQ